jgi:hypothetical protein
MTTWVALVALAVSTEDPPELIEFGFALSVTVVEELGVTVTVVVAVALPPAPLAVAV